MKLFLASEAKHPDSVKILEDFVGGIKGKKIAYIPTAANGEKWGIWREGGSWDLVNSLDIDLTLLQLEDHEPKDTLKMLEGKDIIWVAGGMCGYLMYWMRRRQLDKYLLEVLEKGTIYVGSSAGSMVAGKNLDIAEWYPGDLEYGAHFIPGLSLIDFDMYPHYEEDLLESVKKQYKGKKLYLLKNGEEIIVEDSKITVVGEERIITISPLLLL